MPCISQAHHIRFTLTAIIQWIPAPFKADRRPSWATHIYMPINTIKVSGKRGSSSTMCSSILQFPLNLSDIAVWHWAVGQRYSHVSSGILVSHHLFLDPLRWYGSFSMISEYWQVPFVVVSDLKSIWKYFKIIDLDFNREASREMSSIVIENFNHAARSRPHSIVLLAQ